MDRLPKHRNWETKEKFRKHKKGVPYPILRMENEVECHDGSSMLVLGKERMTSYVPTVPWWHFEERYDS